MNNYYRAGSAATLTAIGLVLSGCSPTSEQQTETFDLSGHRVDIVNHNENMPVEISEQTGAVGVTVTVQTETVGKNADTPQWSIDGSSLNLGTPCDSGFVGYCEGKYLVAVPVGTMVYVNGAPVSTR